MESPNTLTPAKGDRGLTLIEILVVIGILTVLMTYGLVVSLSAFQGDTFLSERSLLASTLAKARSRAFTNTYASPHGVCYIYPNYVIFRGSSCVGGASTNELILANTQIASSSNFTTLFPVVVFTPLTATTTPVTIHLTDGIKSADITINNEGTINW